MIGDKKQKVRGKPKASSEEIILIPTEDSENVEDNEIPIVTENPDTFVTVGEVLSKPSARLCSVSLTKGKRKGLPCDRKIILESDNFCKFHINKAVPTHLCKVILTKGERKNQTCNRKVAEEDPENPSGSEQGLCKIHKTLEQRRPYNPYSTNEEDINLVNVTNVDTLKDEEHDKVLSMLCELRLGDLHERTSNMLHSLKTDDKDNKRKKQNVVNEYSTSYSSLHP